MKQAIPCPNFGKITKSKILPISILTVLSLLFTTASAQLVVDQNASIAAMQSLIEGTGLTISNFTITAGQNQQYGTFTYTPDGVLGLDQGIILSTGTCNQAIGPNNTGASSSNRPDYADPDILLLSPLASRDACVIEFDVVPKCDTLQIDFVFASEEYNEWVCSDFNDAFAFFVSGPGIAGPFSNGAENFAILPDGTGVAIGSVNNGTPGGGMDPANCQSLANAAFFTDNTGGVNLQHDGFTVPLSAKGVVVPCQTYHVKMVIADAGDSSWDSAVFLKSFSCPGQLVDINPDPISPNVVEGCQIGIFSLERGGDTTVALDVDLTFGGTAIYNVDYTLVDIFMNPAPTTVTFAPNEITKIFALLGTQDFLPEGTESIDITATWNICTEVLSATQSFELQDVSVALVCPADMMVPATPGLCGANVTWPLPTVISNCNGVLLNRTDGLPFVQGSFMPLGTYTISYTGIMGGAASDNCSFNITVFDNEAPTLNCPANITTNANASGCSANITMPVLTATDNCGIASITNDRTGSNNASGNYPLGTTVVNWTVTDVNGNVSTCSTTVVVNNSLVANAGADASVCIGTPYTISGSASGGTAPYTYSWNNGLGAGASHAVSPGSTTTYTVTVTDANGCTSTDAVTLTTMVAPNATVSVGVPTCGASNGSITFTFSDTPGRSAIEFSLNGGVSYQSQVNDNSGSVTYNGLSEGTYNLWVRWGNDDCPVELGDFLLAAIDNTNPTIICPAAVNANTDSGACFATVVLTAPATSDNCAVASVTNNAPATFPIGTTTVTWTVTDNAGNSATCTQNVTVTDNENPTITCAAAVNANTNPGSCFATVILTAPATSDNCTVASVTNNAPATFPIGTTTVTWTVTDNAGNSATCTQNVTVTDNENPTITCAPAVNANTNPGSCFATVILTAPATSDNCTVASVTNNAPATFPIGTTTVTWTVTDNAGNTNTCTQNVTVTDNQNPTITCAAAVTANTNPGSCFATVILTAPATSDNCTVASVTNNAPATFPIGTTTVTWTVTDNAGNTATCTQNVTVTDNQNPTITCAPAVNANTNPGSCFATVVLTAPATSDNCTVASVTNNAPATFPIGTTTVTWTVTDNAGNTNTCTQNVTVTDNENPTITCAANVTVAAASGSCFTTVVLSAPATADNCTVASVTNNAPATFPIGTTTVTWTVTDNAGNTATCNQNVTVTDNENPTITCAPAVNANTNPGSCFATVVLVAPTTSDNCGIAGVTNNAPATFPIGTTTVTWTVTDNAGNTATCTQNVTVTDNENPTITCAAAVNINTDSGSCFATVVLTAPTTSDNCTVASVTNNAPATFPIGTTTVTWTVTDNAGNTATCTQNVTVTDNENPTITCAAAVNASADAGSCFATVVLTAPATADNCGVASVTNNAPATFPIGTTTVTWTVTDNAGNTNTCTQNVTVTDNENPTITCAAAVNASADAGSCFATVVLTAPATADNCGVASVTNNAPATFPIGTTTVTWTVTDNAGNTNTCTQNVTVTDNENPTIACPAAVNASADAGSCFATVVLAAPATADNCGVASVTNNAPATFPIGTTTVTWTVTDNAGNTNTCTQNVTVTDNENPTITCAAAVNASADAGSCFATVVLAAPATADNCGVASVTNNAPATFPIGTTTVTWTVTDNAGNTNTCTQNVTVTDNENPTITCAAAVNASADAGSCFATVVLAAPATADNCGVASVTNNAPATFPIGTTTVTWTVTDNAGNTATCTQNVPVTDNENPTITCAAAVNASADAGSCFATVVLAAPATADNCGVASVTNNAPATFPIGTTTVTWTVTDNAGNTATCTQDVVVTDDENPTIACPSDIVVPTDAGFSTANITIAIPATGDNCTVASVVNDFTGTSNASGVYPIGTTTVTYIVTDAAGNSITCSFDVTVSDNQAPDLTCPANQNVDNDALACQAFVSVPLAIATDNDGVASLTNDFNGTGDASGIYPVGTTTVTWTAVDTNGNISTCSMTVTVNDIQSPTIVCPANLTIGSNLGVCEANVTIAAINASDNCGIASITNDFNGTANASGTYPVGTTNVTWTVTDIHGNVSTCTMSVTINDDENPAIACAGDMTLSANPDVCEAIVMVPVPVVSDNCGITSFTNDFNGAADASGTYPVGTTTVIWTATDAAGNTSTCSLDVTITDDQAPAISCSANIIQSNDLGACNAAVTVPALVTSDNCGIASIVNDFNGTADASGTYPVGTTTVTWTVTDISGNVSTCSFDVTVNDDELPVVACPADIFVSADATCMFTVGDYTALFAATDNCDMALDIVQLPAPGTIVSGTTTVTISATDDAGNVNACSFDLIVEDTTNPTITTCATDATVFVDGACEIALADYTSLIAANDNCDLALDITQVPAPGTIFSGNGTVVNVVITVTDDSGNASSCNFNVSLVDNTAPAITCSANIIQSNDLGACDAAVTVPALVTSDNCGIAFIVNDFNGTADASGTYPVGTTTVTWTVTDISGNVSTCSFDVTVNDDELPVVACPADINVSADASCMFTVGDYTALFSATDNCDMSLDIVQSPIAGTVVAGTTTVTLSATDDAGNVNSCSFDLIVEDTTNPTITTCATDATVFVNAACEIALADYTSLIAANDNCDLALDITQVPAPGTIFSGNGTVVNVVITVTDDSGNASSCNFNVSLVDNTAPAITCSANITQSNDLGACDAAVTVPALVTSDNCGIASIVNNFNGTADASGTYPVGTTTVIWTVTDISGNVSTCSFDVTVNDDELPVVACPADIFVSADATCMFTVGDYTALFSATDNCDMSLDIVQSPIAGTVVAGTTTVTLSATDDAGNVNSCSFDLIVEDTTNPTITTCATDAIVFVDAACEIALADYTALIVANDNCDLSLNITQLPAPGTIFSGNGTVVNVVITVTDDSGNATSCNFNVSLVDNTAPAITCSADIIQSNDLGACNAAVTVPALVTSDNCGIASIVNDFNGTADASGTYPVGTTTVTWTVTDISGNVSTCSFDVTVNDDELPVVACTIDITQGSDLGTCDGTVAIAPLVATDNCAIASVSNDFNGTADASGVYPPGTTTVTWSVTDIHGNVTACSFDVTILDTEAPSLTCAGDITQTADGGVCEAAVTIAAPVYSDNCGIASISNDYNGGIDASDVYPVGTTTVTWTIIDMAGNTTTCSLDVTITDNEAPVVTCPSDITVNTDTGTCEANITVPNMIASDNCAILSIVNDYNSGTNASDVYAEGTTIVNWTITDIHGNVTTCSTTITVIDNENPIVACPVNVTQTADAGVCEAAVTIPVVTATDNCAVASIVNDYNGTADGSDTYPVGTTTVVWTITDIHGNVTTCQIDVVITDDEAPVVTCPNDITQTADAGSCDAVIAVDAMIATDNCAIASIVNDYNGTADASDVYTIGTTVVNWTITDIHGNVTTCTTTITITDDEAPVINCPSNISQTADASVCEALVSIPVPFTSDNCSVASVVNDYNGTSDATDIYPVGTTTITWTVTDLAGNTSTCTMDVEVTDNESPTITCQNDIVQNTDTGLCQAFVTVPTLTIFENCAIASVTNDYNGTSDATDIYVEGTTTVVWTVIDIHGNVSTCSMNITITDNQAPDFTCPAVLSQAADLGSCDAVVTMPAVTATDNCGVASIVNDYTGTDDASAIYTIGTTTITWTITDIHGNVSQCTQDITITDDESPILTCPADLTELVDSNCEFVVLDYTSLAVVTDNCDTDVMLTQSPVAGTVLSGSGTVEMITITATDDAGNTTDCTFNVTLDDVIAPAITCPADLTEYVDATCNFELPDYTAMTSTSDNCSVPVMTQVPAPGTIVGLGVYTITITSTDPDGNATDCSFDVTVLDNTAPIIACPGDQTEQPDTSCEHLLGDYTGLVSATDNCSSVTITQTPAPGTVIYDNTTITMTVEDIYGNVSTCNFEVILEDTIDPVITCPQDILVTNDLGVCGAVVTYDLPETSDNCTVADLSLTEGLASGEVFPVGTTVVTYVVTDGFGNTATCSFEVTVTDDEAPLIQCPDNIVAFNDLGVCGTMITFNDPVVSDNCAVDTVVMTEGMASGEVFPVGVTTISYDITDIHGNMNTCSFNIEILDNEAPVVAVCPADITVVNDNGICGAVVIYDAPTVTDNCAVTEVVLVAGLDSGSTFDVGTTTVTWSYTDAAGNTSFCTFNVTVEDPEAPSIVCPNNIVVNNNNSICGAFVTYNMPQVDDNCAVADLQLISGIASGELFPVGVTELTFEVTDIYGNATQCSMTVTVIDAEDPIILCPEDIVQVDPVVYFNEPFYTDNCSATLTMIEGLPSGSVFPHGYTEVIYEAIDEAGNSVLCSFMVLVNTPPDAEDDTANFFEENDTIEIDPLGNDFDADGDDLTISEASASNGDVQIIGNYLYYTPADGWCGTDTISYIACDPFNACDSAIIVVQVECYIDLIIPQAISPNGDGINDVFEIIGLEDYPGNRLSVYNRWGRLVFEADEYDNSFDGHSQDALTLGAGLLPEGTYFFVLDLGSAGIKPVKGYIYINR